LPWAEPVLVDVPTAADMLVVGTVAGTADRGWVLLSGTPGPTGFRLTPVQGLLAGAVLAAASTLIVEAIRHRWERRTAARQDAAADARALLSVALTGEPLQLRTAIDALLTSGGLSRRYVKALEQARRRAASDDLSPTARADLMKMTRRFLSR
jgi:hypothetical protein